MRFKWSRHLVLTAFTAAFLLPLAGCSSSQQGADEEVAAQGQEEATQGEEQGGAEVAVIQGEAQPENGATNPAEGQEAPVNEEVAAENPVADPAIVPVNEAPVNEGVTTDGKELITEMNAPPVNPAAAPAVADPAAAPAVAEATAPQPTGVGGVPEEGSKMPYVVEVGDTLSKIAAKIHGDQKRWREIASLSGITNPNHIFPGDLVYYTLETSSQAFASNYDGIRRAKETVRQGDTLAAIARRVYGSSTLWRHIWRQNDTISNPDKLTAGTSVYYVEKGSVKSAQLKQKSDGNVKSVQNTIVKTTKVIKTASDKTVTNHFSQIAHSRTLAQLATLY